MLLYALSLAFAASSLLLPAWVETRTGSKRKPDLEKDTLECQRLAVVILILSLFGLALFRAFVAVYAFQGELTVPDEGPFGRIYVAGLAAGRSVYSGVSQLTLGSLYYLWYWLTGLVTAPSARLLSSLLASTGVATFFLICRCRYGLALALIATILLSLSVQLELFSALAIETTSVFLFVPLPLLFASWAARSQSPWPPLATGIMFALSLFSYPGTGLFFAAYLFSLFTLRPSLALADLRTRNAFFCALGASAIFAIFAILNCFYFHQTPLSVAEGGKYYMLRGTGIPTFELWKIFDAFFSEIEELLLGGQSLYLDFLRNSPFFEPALWGFFALGLRASMSRGDRFEHALLLTIPVLLLLLAFLDNYGMRRALTLLPGLYFFASLGVSDFIRLTSSFPAARAFVLAGCLGCLIIGFFLVPRALGNYAGSNSPQLSDSVLARALERGDVNINPTGASNEATIARATGELIRLVSRERLGSLSLLEGAAPGCGTLFVWRKKFGATQEKIAGKLPADAHQLTERGGVALWELRFSKGDAPCLR